MQETMQDQTAYIPQRCAHTSSSKDLPSFHNPKGWDSLPAQNSSNRQPIGRGLVPILQSARREGRRGRAREREKERVEPHITADTQRTPRNITSRFSLLERNGDEVPFSPPLVFCVPPLFPPAVFELTGSGHARVSGKNEYSSANHRLLWYFSSRDFQIGKSLWLVCVRMMSF